MAFVDARSLGASLAHRRSQSSLFFPSLLACQPILSACLLVCLPVSLPAFVDRASTRESGLRAVMKFMLHSPDLEPVLSMQETVLSALLGVVRGKGTESQVGRPLGGVLIVAATSTCLLPRTCQTTQQGCMHHSNKTDATLRFLWVASPAARRHEYQVLPP